MLKAVFKPGELVPISDKVIIDSPSNYPELAHYKSIEEEEIEEVEKVEEYTGPTADDLRREAELFKVHWEEEKERMISSANAQAESIVREAKDAAFAEVKRGTDEAQVIKQQAQEEAERIVYDANIKASDIENEVRQSLETLRKETRDKGYEEGRAEGFNEGKGEVDRLINRTQTVLEEAQNKRAVILKEAEQEIVNLVLLIARKVIKVISENQRDIIVSNVVEALRKVRSKGDIIIRVNLADLKIATEHKIYFTELMEGANSIQIREDSTVDSGGCIIETDFGEIDARISSQLTELENKILEISPIKSSEAGNLPKPIIRTANLNADLAASSAMLNSSASDNSNQNNYDNDSFDSGDNSDELELSPAANAALTASAALAALTTMAVKGKRKSDEVIRKGAEVAVERRST